MTMMEDTTEEEPSETPSAPVEEESPAALEEDLTGMYAGIGVAALVVAVVAAVLIARACRRVIPAFKRPIDDWSTGEVVLD
jgi:hypothetical protein